MLTDAVRDGNSYTEPAWSPDSKQIAFVGMVDGGRQIYIIDANGRRRRLLTEDGTHNVSPAWSPEGSRIAYSSNAFGDYDILTINIDGSDMTQVTDNDFDDIRPVWSPDGTKMAYLSLPEVNKGNVLFLINSDGTNPQDVSAGITDINDDVAWSPDGRSIAFSAFPDRMHHQIYGVWSDQWGGTQYSVNDLNNFMPSWSPDGERLVYYAMSKDYESSEVYVNAGGTRNSHQLTYENANVTFVAWVPIKTSPSNVYVFPTVTPVATPDYTDVYLLDEFDDASNGWSTGESTSGKVIYDFSGTGTYTITLNESNWGTSSLSGYRFTNVRIELDASFDPGVKENNFGVICRAQDNDNFYLLRISYENGQGYYRILMQKDDEWEYLMDGVKYHDINPGFNHISASCIDNKLTLAVNGEEVATIYDETFTDGRVGVYAGVWESPPATITFDKFEAIPIP